MPRSYKYTRGYKRELGMADQNVKLREENEQLRQIKELARVAVVSFNEDVYAVASDPPNSFDKAMRDLLVALVDTTARLKL